MLVPNSYRLMNRIFANKLQLKSRMIATVTHIYLDYRVYSAVDHEKNLVVPAYCTS